MKTGRNIWYSVLERFRFQAWGLLGDVSQIKVRGYVSDQVEGKVNLVLPNTREI